MRHLVIIVFLLFLFSTANAARILFLSIVASPSHSHWCKKFINLLATNGHELTVLDTVVHNDFAPNVTSYVLENAYENEQELENLEKHASAVSPVVASQLLIMYSHETCLSSLKSPTARVFADIYAKKEKPFDLIIEDGATCQFFLGFVHMFGNPPLIRVTAFMDPAYLLNFVGNYDNPSYVPMHFTSLEPPMSLTERIANLYYTLYEYYLFNWWYMPRQNEIAKEFFGESLPPLEEIAQRAEITMVNTHFSISVAKPVMPNVIHIGGFHSNEPKPLPKDIKTFLDGAKNGAIYFSLGTNIHTTYMNKEKMNMFLEVFKEIPQRVLWKFKGDKLPIEANNVMISKWLPQNDILGHPNVKIFISHGGQLGTQEAIYHGVPMIIIPFFADQFATAIKLNAKGVAIKLDYTKITKDQLKIVINTLINKSSYQEKMQEWSNAFKDRPLNSRDLVLYWTDYVIRHHNSSYIKSPIAKMPLMEAFFVDVIFIFLIIVLILGSLITVVLGCLVRKLRKPKKLKST